MASIPVIVKHQGKRYNVELDPNLTGETFKYQLFSLTGVEPDRQKIIVKGGQLKDETDLSTLGAKKGQVFMMMGTAAGTAEGAVLERPREQVKFMEDMTDAEVARQHGAVPAGLQNLGNTCYLNSTLQTLRAIPELQEELTRYRPGQSTGRGPNMSDFGIAGMSQSLDLTAALRDLYRQLSDTTQGFPPLMFLSALRTAFPQFAQKAKNGNGYAQQDAEEAWTNIISQLNQKLKLKDGPDGQASSAASETRETSWVKRYLAGQFESTLKCDEAAAIEGGEEPVETQDDFFKLNCHISKDTNHLRDGILAGLEEKLEKKSEVLDRNADYTKTSRISRLPKYLTVHFVRFFWKREAQKKAKIMRKVTFPHELDVVEFCTDHLRKELIPVRDKIREVRKDEEDMQRARKRQKLAQKQEEDRAQEAGASVKPDASEGSKTTGEKKADGEEVKYKTDAEYEAEREAALKSAKKQLFELISPELLGDDGANKSGVYELRGVVTHQGASADSGHYTAYVKKEGLPDGASGKRKEEDGKWWWFNDDKVSEVDADKIETLSGGGESHSALILLYRAIPLPTAEEIRD